MINALKLARTMREAGMPEKQADALAEAVDEGLRETVVTREFLGVTIADLRAEIAQLSSQLTNRMYGIAVGIVTATGLIQYFVK